MFAKINHLWRLLATAAAFALFGVGCLVLVFFYFPILNLVRDKNYKRKNARAMISRCFSFFFKFMHNAGITRYEVRGQELIVNDRSCLVVANHPSLVDVVSIISLYPHANCIVKKELWNNFFIRGVVIAADYIPNDRSEKLLDYCQESLSRGDVLVIFPEGTRSVPGQKLNLHRSAAQVALRLGYPVRTFRIKVSPPALTKNKPWYKIPARRFDFIIEPSALIQPCDFPDKNLPISIAARRLTELFYEKINPECS